jgi:queuosine precursor transporter
MNHQDRPDAELKFFWPLVLVYTAFQLIADVTAGKIIALGGFYVSATVLYFPVTYIISDILTEVYGYARARRALWLVMAASISAGIIYQLVVLLPPAPFFKDDAAYATVLGVVPRILVAGWVAVFIGDLFAPSRQRWWGRVQIRLCFILGRFGVSCRPIRCFRQLWRAGHLRWRWK